MDILITQFLENPSSYMLLIGVSLGVVAWWIISNWDKLKRPYGWLLSWYDSRKKKEELLQMIIENNNKTKDLEDKVNKFEERVNRFEENQQIYHQQSIEIRDGLDDKIEAVQKNINDHFNDLEEKNNKRVRAELKDKIGASYRYYHAKGKINDIEWEALEDLIKAYEDANGNNSFIHSVVQKEMYSWEKTVRE